MSSTTLKLCLICVEVFGWGKYGGFGRATRLIGTELAKRGIKVVALVPKRREQSSIEQLDGLTVVGFPPANPVKFLKLVEEIDADIYHSQNISIATYLATRAKPGARHIATLRDPKLARDWAIEWWNPSRNRLQVMLNWLYEDSMGISGFVRRLDGIYVAAPHLRQKAAAKFKLSPSIEVLPTPIKVPCHDITKADKPTALFLGRLDRRKRPEMFLELAKKFSDIEFITVGKSNDPLWERQLRQQFSDHENIRFEGFINQFTSEKLYKLLEQSWIIVNTAVREGIATATLEGLAYQCAVLSKMNSENEAKNFGYHAFDDDFAAGMQKLLENDAWREKGMQGQRWVAENFELNMSIEKHIKAYEDCS